MKKSLTHLPENKRNEIKSIILFDSYAGGDRVEDSYPGKDGSVYEHQSDYGLPVVADDPAQYEYRDYRNRIKRKARRSASSTHSSIIMHSIQEVKDAIKTGRQVDRQSLDIFGKKGGNFKT